MPTPSRCMCGASSTMFPGHEIGQVHVVVSPQADRLGLLSADRLEPIDQYLLARPRSADPHWPVRPTGCTSVR